MTGGPRPPHAVLARSPEAFSPAAVAAVLAVRAGVPALDAVAGVRKTWGVIAESLPAAEAEELAAALTKAGQEAVAVPVGLLEEVPAPVGVNKAGLGCDGFDLAAGRENPPPERLAWSRLAVVAAAAVEVVTTKSVVEPGARALGERAIRLGLTLATGMPLLKKAAPAARPVEVRDRRLLLDLVFAGPARRVRIDAADFDYSALGPRMGYAAELNFRALLEDVVSRAPSALRGRGTRAVLDRRPASESLYESLDDLGREERWLLSLAALR